MNINTEMFRNTIIFEIHNNLLMEMSSILIANIF